jgi:ABC-type dipeptide/oligopeptide/nickel transport system ATPase component
LVLHASAVTLPNGSTVAFLGESGSGKSTLASYCQLQGAQIIDDDCILLRTHEGETRVTGGAPTLRLYPDSLRALGHNAADFAPYADGSSKLQMRLTHDSQSQQLTAVFLLNAPLTESSGKAVSIQPAAGQVAMMSMLNSVFSLDPSDTGTQADTFRRVAQTLGAGLPVYNLHYPREHTALPQVLHALQRVGAADLHRQATDLSIC